LNTKENIKLPFFFRYKKYPPYNDEFQIENRKIYQLSLGQRQRISYLRAMGTYPRILLCDEPTASLDQENAIKIMELLKEESKKRLVIYVSHNEALVRQYSDEIIHLEDGKIKKHEYIHECLNIHETKYPFTFKKPILLLTLFSMKSHLSRMIQLLMVLTISLTCILFTNSLSYGFHDQINKYIDSIIPASSISFRLKTHSSLQLEDLNIFQSYVLHSHLYLNEYELIAFGKIEERYNSQNAIEIVDDSGYIKDNQIIGKLMTNDDEIVVSKKAAMHYLGSDKVEDILNQKVNLWYKYQNKVRGYTVSIVGVYDDHKDYDSIYHLSSSSFTHIQQIYENTPNSYYGILYVDDVETAMKQLSQFHNYEFKEVGKSTKENIQSFMNKVEIVLIIFCALAIISSLFLLCASIYLEVLDRKKDIAIMKCYGAKFYHIIYFIFSHSLFVYILSMIFSYFHLKVFIMFVNYYFKDEMLIDGNLLFMNYSLIIIVYIIGFILLVLSQIIPIIYALQLNTSECLKQCE
jgi:energy-coupling factor transporter ATP-binding protein EcfA2